MLPLVSPENDVPTQVRNTLTDALARGADALGIALTAGAVHRTAGGFRLEAWCWNEALHEHAPLDGVREAAARLVERLERAAQTGAMSDTLDVLEVMERQRRFDAEGCRSGVLRFAYRLERAEALARLDLSGRLGLLFLDPRTEENSIVFRLGADVALVHEGNLNLDELGHQGTESIRVYVLDENGRSAEERSLSVPVIAPGGDLAASLEAFATAATPVALGRDPASGMPFVAVRGDDGSVEVFDYVVHSAEVDLDRIEGFAPATGGGAAWRRALMCPACGRDLAWDEASLGCACGATYPVEEGRPRFLTGAEAPPALHPDEVWAPNPKQKVLLYFLKKYPDGIVLDCGSGDADFRADNLVNLEVYPFRGVDVVASGQRLPFRDNSVDAVVSAAVLEHVPNPFEYCSELYRVLKPGGEVRIDSAFLQPYHACPDHYFGTTRSGLAQAASQFRPVAVAVAPGQSPYVGLQTWLAAYAQRLPDEASRERFYRRTVGELLTAPGGIAPRDIRIPPLRAADVAAGVYFHGQKPMA